MVRPFEMTWRTTKFAHHLQRRNLPPIKRELTAGQLAAVTHALALDPGLLLSNLHGFNSSTNHIASINADS